MAATDIKAIFVKTEPNGETWLYQRLCNGTESAVFRICCNDNPDDPGNIPDPPIAAEICRVANGMSEQLQIWIERLAQLMTEQPDNPFGDAAAATIWVTELYDDLIPDVDEVQAVVAQYSPDETDIYAGTQDAAFLKLLVCAVYRSIVQDANGINLSPTFAQNVALNVLDIEPDPPDAQVSLALVFAAALMPHFRFATLKRWAYDASIVDPGTVTDLECDECGATPTDPTACEDCESATCTKFVHDVPVSGWTVSGYTSTGSLASGGKVWVVDGVAGGSVIFTKDSGTACINQINVRCYFTESALAPRTDRVSIIVDGVNILDEFSPIALNIHNANCDAFDTNLKFNIANELGITAIEANTIEFKMPDDRSLMHILQVDLFICDEP